MSGGQDEASERINVGDLPYWLAGPIKRLEARVERLEEEAKTVSLSTSPATKEEVMRAFGADQPAKRREWWWCVYSETDGLFECGNKSNAEYHAKKCKGRVIRVIAAPSEAEIEAAVDAGWNEWRKFQGRTVDDAIRTAIRKLLGGGE